MSMSPDAAVECRVVEFEFDSRPGDSPAESESACEGDKVVERSFQPVTVVAVQAE